MLDANRFIFSGENTSLTIKHDSNNFNLASDISSQGRFSNQTYNYGTINAANGTTILSGDNSSYNGKLNIAPFANVIVNNLKNLGNATIANNGWLDIDTQSDWNFSNTMTGDGILTVNTGNNIFSFQNATNTAGFSGSLLLNGP